jgi:hypothetical protein
MRSQDSKPLFQESMALHQDSVTLLQGSAAFRYDSVTLSWDTTSLPRPLQPASPHEPTTAPVKFPKLPLTLHDEPVTVIVTVNPMALLVPSGPHRHWLNPPPASSVSLQQTREDPPPLLPLLHPSDAPRSRANTSAKVLLLFMSILPCRQAYDGDCPRAIHWSAPIS